MLIQSAKELEKDGIVWRKVYCEVPPRVEYSPTALGPSFIPVLLAKFEWGKSYAAYLVAKADKQSGYQPGKVFENMTRWCRRNPRKSAPDRGPRREVVKKNPPEKAERLERTLRELESDDIQRVVGYFLEAAPEFLEAMGVDRAKLPARDEWQRIIHDDLARPLEARQFYYLIWEIDGTPVGHSNINKIVFGREAYMHLHLWRAAARRSGHGFHFIRESIARYFERFRLQNLFCEPYARNPAPNRLLTKVGFAHVQTYETTPGWINFPQTVKRWVLTRENWRHG